MDYTMEQYRSSAQAIRERLGDFTPKAAMVLGSGLGALGDEVENPIVIPYGEVPHMRCSTAPDHRGQFVFGRLSGQDVAVMQGRVHYYEGYSVAEIAEILKLGQSAVKMRLKRGRELLKIELEGSI